MKRSLIMSKFSNGAIFEAVVVLVVDRMLRDSVQSVTGLGFQNHN